MKGLTDVCYNTIEDTLRRGRKKGGPGWLLADQLEPLPVGVVRRGACKLFYVLDLEDDGKAKQSLHCWLVCVVCLKRFKLSSNLASGN